MNLEAIRAAIKHFESLQRRYTTTHNGKQCELVKTVIAALRECAEREMRCAYCGEERHHIREAFDDGTARVVSSMNHYALSVETPADATTSSIFPIHFCPMCGRKLERSDT